LHALAVTSTLVAISHRADAGVIPWDFPGRIFPSRVRPLRVGSEGHPIAVVT
jgi:hypothetical protein